MNVQKEKTADRISEIKTQIKELSRLLGMTPLNDPVKMQEPVSQKEMELPDWLSETRQSFLKLSVLISEELHLGIAETNLESENFRDKIEG